LLTARTRDARLSRVGFVITAGASL
jgi:hypothetical protein